MTQTTEELLKHYLKLIQGTADGALKAVCEANGISLDPLGKDLRPIPVYEEDSEKSLLSLANELGPTTIRFLAPQNFLQAYCKRYRHGRKLHNDIAILTPNYCWARFYAAKELMHCMLEDDGIAATNTLDLVKDLIESLAIGSILHLHEDCKPQTIVDEVAWVGAYLYVIPDGWVPALAKLHSELSDAFPDDAHNHYRHIAQIIRVPEVVLKHRLRHHRK